MMISNMIVKVAKATVENGECSLGFNDPGELNLRSMQTTMAAYHIHGNDLIHSSRIRWTNLWQMESHIAIQICECIALRSKSVRAVALQSQ